MARTRKVQLTGASTFIVSLPKTWAKKNNVGKGTELSIEEAESGSLLIRPSGFKQKESRVVFHIDEKTEWVDLERALVASYINGFGVIELASAKALPLDLRYKITNALKRMTGFELVDEKPEHMVLQDFFSDKEFSFEKILKRCHIISTRMQDELWLAMEEKDAQRLKATLELEHEIDRLSFLVKRQLRGAVSKSYRMESLNLKQNQLVEYYLVFEMEERISDRINDTSEELLNIPEAFPSKDALAILKEAHDFTLVQHKAALKAFFENDVRTANRLIDKTKEFHKNRTEMMKRLLSTKGPKSMSLILMARYGEIMRLSGDICEAVLDIPPMNPLEVAV